MKRITRMKTARMMAAALLISLFCYSPVLACEEQKTETPVNNAQQIDLNSQLELLAQLNLMLGLGTVQPNIEVSPTSLDFGQVQWNTASTTKSITITNSGDADLVIAFRDFKGINATGQTAGSDGKVEDDSLDFIMSDSGFAYDKDKSTYTLASDKSGTVTVYFKPRDIGSSSATMLCLSNDPDQNQILLTFKGEGTAPPTTTSTLPILDQFFNTLSATLQVSFGLGQSYYVQNGEAVPMDAATFAENDRTYVPLRYLGAAMGALVSWDEQSKTASLSKGGQTVSTQPGSNLLFLNNLIPVPMDVTVLQRDGCLYLPARYVAEQFGYNVDWDDENQQVLMTE